MLTEWKGRLGDEYTDRNQPTVDEVGAQLRPIVRALRPKPRSILEVGCNRGTNLLALACLFPATAVYGVEPNRKARDVALSHDLFVLDGEARLLPLVDKSVDLVFTAGVLIHVPPDELDRALGEMHRVAAKHVLMVEYDGAEHVEYRGSSIWKREYGREWKDRFPVSQIEGIGWIGHGPFAGCNWWAFAL